MKILEKITKEGKQYICIQKVLISGNIIYVCREKDTKQSIFLKENEENRKLEETKDENIKKEIEKLICVERPDYKISIKNK